MARSGFGQVTKLPSGRYRARYTVPGTRQQWVNAPTTFEHKKTAQAWLARQRTEIEDGVVRPTVRAVRTTLNEYAATWLATRRSLRGGLLRPATRAVYESYLRNHVEHSLGRLALPAITRDAVRSWFAGLPTDTPTNNARVYSLVRTILAGAVDDGLLDANPCHIRGAGQTTAKTPTTILDPGQVQELAEAMPEHLRIGVLLAAWCALRSGEILELRRKDVDVDGGIIRVARAVTFTYPGPKVHIGAPKTAAGVRTIAAPPHVAAALAAHLDAWVPANPEALLLVKAPGDTDHLTTGAYGHRVKLAARAIDLPATFRPHHLRHTGLTLAARAGATVAELQRRAGHSTPAMVARYQHGEDSRDRAIADALSRLVTDD